MKKWQFGVVIFGGIMLCGSVGFIIGLISSIIGAYLIMNNKKKSCIALFIITIILQIIITILVTTFYLVPMIFS